MAEGQDTERLAILTDRLLPFHGPTQCECSAGIPSLRTVSRSKSNSIITAGSSPTTQPSCPGSIATACGAANSTVQPSNSLPGLKCSPEPGTFYPCTMVQNEAYGRPNGGEIAPKTGTIETIRLIGKYVIPKLDRDPEFRSDKNRAAAG